MRLGVIADAHLSPPGTRVSAFHTGYESPYTAAAYRLGDRMVVRRRSLPLVSPSAVNCPILSPPRQEWVFEAGEWSISGSVRPKQEVAN